MLKRIALFLATNLAVLLLLGIVLSVLQAVFGISLRNDAGLLVIAAVFG
ncbi:protease HtpX, partial [Acinetobacter baumannii]